MSNCWLLVVVVEEEPPEQAAMVLAGVVQVAIELLPHIEYPPATTRSRSAAVEMAPRV